MWMAPYSNISLQKLVVQVRPLFPVPTSIIGTSFLFDLISDNRILEYKFEDVLFSKQSDFQQIQIVETADFGRLLILNDMANLAENDKVEYTHTLMNLPNENYGVN